MILWEPAKNKVAIVPGGPPKVDEDAAAKLQFLCLRAEEWPTDAIRDTIVRLESIITARGEATDRSCLRDRLAALAEIHAGMVEALRPIGYGPSGKDDGVSYTALAATANGRVPGKHFRKLLTTMGERIAQEIRNLQ